jgi:GT2 family glycosyltransferase
MAALAAQRTARAFETILVESSGDGAADLVRARWPQVRVVALARRARAGPARNAGIEAARGRFLLCLDVDCRPAPDWLERLCAVLASGEADVVSAAVANGTPRSPAGTAMWVAEFSSFAPFAAPGPRDRLAGTNLAFRRTAFEAVGGFADIPWAEDILFTWVAARLGLRVALDTTTSVAHVNRTDVRRGLRHSEQLGTGAARVLRAADMPGAWYARGRGRWALYALARLASLARRAAGAGPGAAATIARALPLAGLHFAFFAAGFRRGALGPPDPSVSLALRALDRPPAPRAASAAPAPPPRAAGSSP